MKKVRPEGSPGQYSRCNGMVRASFISFVSALSGKKPELLSSSGFLLVAKEHTALRQPGYWFAAILRHGREALLLAQFQQQRKSLLVLVADFTFQNGFQ